MTQEVLLLLLSDLTLWQKNQTVAVTAEFLIFKPETGFSSGELRMSSTVSHKKVTVITIKPGSENILPPLCKLLWELCCSPACCSFCQGLLQTSVTAALGTIQIMVGLFNIGLGPGRTSLHPGDFTDLGAAYWLGAVYIVAGIMCILAGQLTSPCLVGFTVFLNFAAVIFSITGIVLYAIDLSDASVLWLCDWSYVNGCREVARFAQNLLTSMDITLIILAVLQLCVTISVTVIGIKALVNMEEKDEIDEEDEPLLKEVLMTSPGA